MPSDRRNNTGTWRWVGLWIAVGIGAFGLAALLTACATGGQEPPPPTQEPCDCPEPQETVIPHGVGEWLRMAEGADDSLMKSLGQGAIIRENEWRRANGLPEVEMPGRKEKRLKLED